MKWRTITAVGCGDLDQVIHKMNMWRTTQRGGPRRAQGFQRWLQSNDTEMLMLVTAGTKKLPSRLPRPGPT